MLSSLNLGVKTQQYFMSSSDMFVGKKTLLEIWLNPGLNLIIFWGTGLSSLSVFLEIKMVIHVERSDSQLLFEEFDNNN